MSDSPELHEDVALDPERRRYVLEVHARLATLSYYELLGVPRGAAKQVVRRAYFELVRVVHPDRYFGKPLGSYKAKLEGIFARMTLAYETLSVDDARRTYDASLPASAATPSATAPSATAPSATAPSATASSAAASSVRAPVAPVASAVAARRAATLAALQTSLTGLKAKAAEHAQAAARALAAGDVSAAAAAYREALRLSPNDPALRTALDDVQRVVVARSCETNRRQAALEEQHGHWLQAAASWRRVLEAQPGDAETRTRLAQAEARAAARTPR